jgi:hypothetical protein
MKTVKVYRLLRKSLTLNWSELFIDFLFYWVLERRKSSFRCESKIAKSDCWLRRVRPSAWNNSAPTGRIFVKFDIREFFENLSNKNQVSLKSAKNNEYFKRRTFHLVVFLTTGPKPLPKQAFHIVRSRASSFKWEYPLLPLRSSSSFQRLVPRLPVTSISPFVFSSITCTEGSFYAKCDQSS